MNTSYKRGFAGLFIIIAIAVAAAIGGGVYYSHKKAAAPAPAVTSADASAASKPAATATSSSSASIKAFLSFKGSQKCTVSSSVSNGQIAGTVYIHDGLLRGDFNSTVAGKAMDSHILRVGDSIYAWTGSQGAKIGVSSLEALQSSSMNKSQVSLDQKVDYSCEAWTANDAEFNVPTGISFIDVAAMMKAYVK